MGDGYTGAFAGVHSRISIAVMLLCLIASSCARETSAPESASETAATGTAEASGALASSAARDIAMAIDASKFGLRSEHRKSNKVGVDVEETRYYVGNTLVLIEEIVGSPQMGRTATAYYFDDDRLVFFRGRGTRTILTAGGGQKRENFDIEIGYDENGNVVDAVKLIDGQVAELEPLDYEAPKARARMFLQSHHAQ